MRLPNWLNPWWSEIREIRTPLDEQSARTIITNASGFLKGSLGRAIFQRELMVFRDAWWHLRRPFVIARVTAVPASPGSIVRLRLGRTWFQAAFITFFAAFALAIPLVFWGFSVFVVVTGNQAPTLWWTYLAWEAQDTAIYAAAMAVNSAAVRRASTWLVRRIAELVNGTPVASASV
jgi:hypothetical protein